MSDSEGSDFHMVSDGESDGYVEAPTLKKVPAKKAAAAPKAKAAPKKAAATKKAPLATKKNLPNDSFSEDDDYNVFTSPARPMVNGTTNGDSPKATKKKTASEMYQKLSQLEHVLKRPDTYIGSVEPHTQPMWVFDPETKSMVNRTITYVPGFFKIFDEILVNAADNKINDPTMDMIKVNIDRENNSISVWNNGKGIPVEMHSKEGIMIPELIFGNLLTSSNYDDDQKKLTGGRNGYGAKLANIYSLEFVVETADKSNMKKYKQVFSQNMGKKTTPKITENKKGEEWTQITFKPDLARFSMTNIDDDTYALLMKRVYDVAGTVKDIKVNLNGERIKIKGFKQYVEMYVAANSAAHTAEGAAVVKPSVVYENAGKRWEVAFALSDGEFNQVSFANSIATVKGGTHVDMIATQLANKLQAFITKKNKTAKIKPFQIKNHMWIFVNALIENPSFDSQTKETLTLKSSAFGSKCELSEDFVKKVAKSGIVENVLAFAKFKQDQAMKKTDGAKRSRLGGIAKLDDANWAGGRNASQCTLILTEGDSAKSMAVSGVGAIQGRDRFGIFPLRGKLLNVREASHDQIMKNQEIQDIKKILGLKHNHHYTSTDSLRYGHLMIMTDQDHDGSHIKGLIINFLDHFYPSLLKIPNFLNEFITPIVKVTKGKQERMFFTMPEYEEWKEENNNGHGWFAKYLKGLGSSETPDIIKYFNDLQRHRLKFGTLEDEDKTLIDLAFNKKKADDRKEWLRQFKPGTFLQTQDIEEIPISDFVNKELILFSMADNIRSIPSIADGLKPGQRKVMFGCFKKKIKNQIKVQQVVGYVIENAAYHHGEASLYSTIVALAQNFIGSNNINLLSPNGQFGTRLQGGKDAASARYIFTSVPRITRAIFHPADEPILNNLFEEGLHIEPEFYMPVVPMVLINGADGIGTGWSTYIPNYNPKDVVENIRRIMRGEEPVPMTPWYRGFKGTIEPTEKDRYKVSGIAEKIDDKTIEITELPVRKWTQDYKEMIEQMTSGSESPKVVSVIKDYEENHTDTTVHFRLHMKEEGMKKAEAEGFDKFFKLTTTISTSNMVCFDMDGKIRKYASPEEILSEFYPKRLEYYALRKQYLADDLNKQFDRLSNQARFVQMIIRKELTVSNKKKKVIVQELRDLNFRPFPKGGPKPATAGEDAPTLEEEEEEDQGSDGDFDYLLGMAIWNLTEEKVQKLLQQRDAKEEELIELLKLTPQDIWNKDLDEFLEEWENCLEEDEALRKATKPKTKAAVKRAVKARKRAKGEDTDDSEDDFKPTKKVTKPRAPAKPRAAPKAASRATSVASRNASPVKGESSSANASPVKAAASSDSTPLKRSSASLSEDEDIKPPTKKTTTSRAKTPATASIVELDSDEEEEKPVVKKPAARAKPKPKPKTVDIDDSDDDMYTISAPKSSSSKPASTDKKPAARSAPAKSKKVVEDPDSDEEVLPKPAAKAKAAPKGKKKDASDFENSDDEVAPPPPRTTARRGRAAAVKKPTYIDLSDSDDE